MMDLVEAAEQAVEANDAYARTHGTSFHLSTAMTAALVRADPLRIAQVFANLLSNAAKFSPAGGQVAVTLTRVGRQVRVGVRDHGDGIPEAFRPHIFERFSQADGSNTRQKGGTGLGLSISQAIVQRHNGEIGFDTQLGEGTEFYFELPLIQTAPQVAPRDRSRPRVLICEDNADVAEILAELLDAEGLAADVVHTISSARAKLAENPYALMLLDLHLPDGDGLDLIRELRHDPSTRELPIVIVSGRAEPHADGASGGVEVMDWLQKPVDQARLAAAVRRAFATSEHPRVLHVEDDLDVAQITQVALDGLAQCTSVTTRAEAEALLETEDLDLVILDLQLADGPGAPLLEALRGRCPVVIFSGLEASPELTREVAAALTKSRASNAELVAVVQSILEPSPET